MQIVRLMKNKLSHLLILSVILSVSLIGVVVISNQASAKARETDLKSDLELEIEGIDPHQASQPETTPTPKPKLQSGPIFAAPPKNDLDSLIERAQILVEAKRYQEAVDLLTPSIDLLPRTGLLILAKGYAGTKDLPNELKTLALAVVKNPKDYVVKTSYGLALLHAQHDEDALQAFLDARELNPRYKPAYDLAVDLMEKRGERYEARNLVFDMIKVFGPKSEFYTKLCRLLALDNYNEKTVEICQAAIEKNDKIPENHVYLGLALKNREENDKSRRVLADAAQRFPASEPVQSALGDLYFSQNDFINAYQFYKKACTADGSSSRAWLGYANSSFKLQKNEEALLAFVRVCKIDHTQIKDFRLAIGELRVRKDQNWQSKFENAINDCQ